MKESAAKRWRAVRGHRSNLALVVAGCALLLLAVGWRFALAPYLKVQPTDLEQVLFYDGTLTTYVNPPGQPPAGPEPERLPVRLERTILSKPLLSTPGTSIVEVMTRLVTADYARELSVDTRVYALDRRTGELRAGESTDRERSGYYIVFPFDTPREAVPYWSELTGGTHPAGYLRETSVDGLSVYAFATSFGGEPVAEVPEGYPPTIGGSLLKEVLSMPDLEVAQDEAVKLGYTGSSTVELKVEPRAGNIVEMRGDESVSVTATAEGGRDVVTRVLYRLEYAQVAGNVKAAAAFARDEVSKLDLQFRYIPLGLLALALAVTAIGTFAGVAVKGSGPEDWRQTRSV